MPCNQQPDYHNLSDPTTKHSHSLSDPTTKTFSQFIRPMTLNTPSGDYETRNFFWEDFIQMNTLQMLLTLIAIFLFVSFEQALDSQRNNKDIFQNDSREMQRAKEMLWSDHSNFCTIYLKSETNDRSAFERFSVPVPNDVPASTMSSFLSQLTVVPTSIFSHFHLPMNATSTATGLTSLNDV